MTKKIIVVQKDFSVGGIATACMNFISKVSKTDVDLTLVSFDEIEEDIPNNVHFIKACKQLRYFAKSNSESQKIGFGFRLCWLINRILCKIFGNKYLLKAALSHQPGILGEYDLAISFAPSTDGKSLCVGNSEFVLEKINAKTKVVVFHNDFCSAGLNTKFVIDRLAKFDKILCVSKSCAKSMKNTLPSLSTKIDFLYNFADVEKIVEKSKEKQCEYNNEYFNIVSVSRLSEEKAHMRSLKVFKHLHDTYGNFIWHIVGDGKERNALEDFVRANDMQDYVKFYGSKDNPYPYIKNADLFYLGSYHEAAPMVYGESMILGCPVLTTNTCSSKEMIPPEYGYICENSEEGIYNGLKEVLENPKLVAEKRENLKSFQYDNDAIVEKLLDLIKEK